MKREGRALYFEPSEREPFFRAIREVLERDGRSEEVVRDLIEHEKAHLDAYDRLNIQDRLVRYCIFTTEYGLEIVIENDKSLTREQLALTNLAPINPSVSDLVLAARAFSSYHEEYASFRAQSKIPTFRDYLLDKLQEQEASK